MKYEKFQHPDSGEDWIRIHVNDHEKVERKMVEGDEALFAESDTATSPDHEPVPAGDEPPADDPPPAEEPEPTTKKRRR